MTIDKIIYALKTIEIKTGTGAGFGRRKYKQPKGNAYGQ